MPPYTILKETETKLIEPLLDLNDIRPIKNEDFTTTIVHDKSYRTLWGSVLTPIKWINVIFLVSIHLICLYGLITRPIHGGWYTVIWLFLVALLGGVGVTGGAHRLWTHRAYKAKLPLRIILMIGYAVAGQNKIFNWVQDHRVHHKFSETDADPHNANRGFFFAHVGWLMLKKHPEVIKQGKKIDCSDILDDPVVAFHEKHFWTLKALICFIIPTLVPYYFWNEDLYGAFMANMVRFVLALNGTWSVNSAAHIFGTRPYDKRIQPVENFTVSVIALGEGWHNYHHTFPWDYKAAELGKYSVNVTTAFIDLFAKIGWAYDLKTPSEDLVKKIIMSQGDGTHTKWGCVKKEF